MMGDDILEDGASPEQSNAIVEISIEGLFGRSDYRFPLGGNPNCLIIYGANGAGKTVIMRMVHALFAGELAVFSKVPFGLFTVTLADGTNIAVSQETRQVLQLSLAQPDAAVSTARVDTSVAEDTSLSVSPYSLFLRGLHEERRSELRLPDWLPRARASTSVRLIETDRATKSRATDDRRGQLEPVGWCAADVGRRLERAATDYAANAQSIDRTFPSRFLAGGYPVASAPDLLARLAAVTEGFSRMSRIGLLKDTETPALATVPPTLEEHQLRFLSLYAEDATQKLRSIDGFAERVELFIQHISEWLDDKIIEVTPRRGFVIRDRATGGEIPYEGLSSGERHVLVMWHELLFCTPPGALVLIDEPEISWHVSWQKRFLEDLLRASSVVGFGTLIATHSPFIPGERLELTFPLGRQG